MNLAIDGRMVRTPLAERIKTNDFLNSVSLALPHYDERAVDAIVRKLQDPELGSAGEVIVLVSYAFMATGFWTIALFLQLTVPYFRKFP